MKLLSPPWKYCVLQLTEQENLCRQTINFYYLSHPSFCRHSRRFRSHSYYSHHNHQSHHILCNGEKERSDYTTAQDSQSNAHTTLNFVVFGHPALCKQPLQAAKPGLLIMVQKHFSFYVTHTETCKWKDLILMKIVPLLLMFILNTKPRILIHYRFFSDKHIQPNGHYSYCHFLFLDKYVRNMRLPREPVFIR